MLCFRPPFPPVISNGPLSLNASLRALPRVVSGPFRGQIAIISPHIPIPPRTHTPSPPTHTADPDPSIFRDMTVKVLVCLYTGCWNALCIVGSGGLWSLYLFPALFYPYCRTRILPLAAAITFSELERMSSC